MDSKENIVSAFLLVLFFISHRQTCFAVQNIQKFGHLEYKSVLLAMSTKLIGLPFAEKPFCPPQLTFAKCDKLNKMQFF